VGKRQINTSQAFGMVLRALRKEAGLTQEQLGFEANLRRTYISTLELGEQLPSLETVFKLAWALKIAPAELVDRVNTLLSNDNAQLQ
jgi:transcriptional regulator with XRE-family HTH domain